MVLKTFLGGLAAMTEKEKKLIQQMYEKVCEMDKKLGNRLDKLDCSLTSLESNVSDLTNEHTGLQATFENGFRDIHESLDEIKQINKNRKTAQEIVEGIAGNGK